MSRSSALSRLVETGMTVLHDTTELTTSRTWYRNGGRGALHAQRHCIKYAGLYSGGESVELSFLEASGKRQCTSCCDIDVLPPHLLRILSNLEEVKRLAERAESRRTISDIDGVSEALRSIRLGRTALERIDNDERDLVEVTHRQYSETLDAIERDVMVNVDALRTQLQTWCATSILRGRKLVLPATTSSEKVAMLGTDPRGMPEAEGLYQSWCAARADGRDAARVAVQEHLVRCKLSRFTQCDFTLVESIDEGGNLMEALERAWRSEAERLVFGQLLPYWELNWDTLSGGSSPRLIGLPLKLQKPESHSVIGAYPHRKTSSGGHILVLAPEVVCRWLDQAERSWRDIPQMGPPCEPEEIDIVAALWEPETADSSYHSLEEAVVAARSLHRD